VGACTGSELGMLTPTQRRVLLVRIETKKRTARDAHMEEIARLLAQIDVIEREKAKEKAEMIFIEIMVLVFGLMIGFAVGRLW
jgi:hypothetical protein